MPWHRGKCKAMTGGHSSHTRPVSKRMGCTARSQQALQQEAGRLNSGPPTRPTRPALNRRQLQGSRTWDP